MDDSNEEGQASTPVSGVVCPPFVFNFVPVKFGFKVERVKVMGAKVAEVRAVRLTSP
jgi:hypothetical protein